MPGHPRRPGRILATVLLCITGTASVSAQSTGGLRGVVTDPHGDPLPGVIIGISSDGRPVPNGAQVTDAAGAFQASALPPGDDYSVKASFPALATVIVSEVAINAARVTLVKIIMQPAGELRERVEVRAEPQIVDLESTTTETRFSAEFVDALPILGRNYQDVLTLAPGVSDVDGDGNPNIHGARDTDVGTLVDGISTTDPLTGKLGAQLNIESIQEIEVKTSGATAEFGRAQGGFANVITKSGGNDFEGTFKAFWRGSALDGDGAGGTDPRLHAGLGGAALGELEFDDYLPFLSLAGPLVRDRAWFFVALEYIQIEEPVNVVSAAFVSGIREQRHFGKLTWQVGANHRLALSLNYDPQQFLNEGLNSFTPQETGFTVEAGGLLVSLKDVSVLSPTVVLETAVAHFEGDPQQIPNTGVDNNFNGVTYIDRDGNGFLEAEERDPGEDFDGDGAFDVWEDTLVVNGKLDEEEWKLCSDAEGNPIVTKGSCAGAGGVTVVTLDEDGFRSGLADPFHPSGDGDNRLTPPNGCEGDLREDRDCDGHLDAIVEDNFICRFGRRDPRCNNGRLDPDEDVDGDGRLDPGTEDRDGNGRLDDTPFPTSDYPYGRLTPRPADRDYTVDQTNGVVSGPFYTEFDDTRARSTLRQDLGIFIPEFHGTHDLRLGYMLEQEDFTRVTQGNDIIGLQDPGWVTGTLADQAANPSIEIDCNPYEEPCIDPGFGRVITLLPGERSLDQSAEGSSLGLYVQDTYKPLPNLSIGLGVRFDREGADSRGYTYFDPAAERREFDRLLALAGSERGGTDLTLGDGNGVKSNGIQSDPISTLQGGVPHPNFAAIEDTLRDTSISRLTQHRSNFNFTLNELKSLFPGLFVDDQLDPTALAALGVKIQQPQAIRITNNNLAPRLAISWDPWADGRTKLFATWGRYYDKLFLNSVIGEQGIERLARYYVYDRSGVNARYDADAGMTFSGAPSNHIGRTLSQAPPSVTQVDRGLRTPFNDEFTVGFERELAPEVALSIRYIDRRFRDQLQDIDINHHLRENPLTGELLDQFGTVIETGGEEGQNTTLTPTEDGRPDLFINNFFFNEILRVGNFNEARYKAIEIELLKRLSRRWQLQSSYTYSRAFGAAEDFQSRLGNDPSTVESEFGPLDFDQRHVVKLNTTTFLPGDWQLGVAASWSSGLPYSVVSRFFALDNVSYQQFRTRFGFVEEVVDDQGGKDRVFRTLSRNSERNHSVYDFNLRAKKSFVIGRTSAALFLEVFNLLNSDDLRVVSFQPTPGGSGLSSGDVGVGAQRLQLDATRRFGRRYQVGFQFNF
jgi:hypothetical protein